MPSAASYITISAVEAAFAISFVAAMLSTALVFGCMSKLSDIFWMIPLMGFCQLMLFGGLRDLLSRVVPHPTA